MQYTDQTVWRQAIVEFLRFSTADCVIFVFSFFAKVFFHWGYVAIIAFIDLSGFKHLSPMKHRFCRKADRSAIGRSRVDYFNPDASKNSSALRSRDASGLRLATVLNCFFSC